MQSILLLLPLFLLQYTTTAKGIDLLQEGRRVVLQQDVDHVLVRLDLTQIQRALKASRKAIVDARGLVMVNSLGRKADPDTKQILKLLEHLNLEIGLRENTFNKLFERSDSTRGPDMAKRAIEFIGDMISSISGVPSARDHRRMLEKMKLLKLDADELQIFMRKTTDTNKAILSSMHFHDGAITANTEKLALAMSRINLQANKAPECWKYLISKQKLICTWHGWTMSSTKLVTFFKTDVLGE